MLRKIWLAETPLAVAILIGFLLYLLLRLLDQVLWVLVLVLVAFILAAAIMPIVRALRRIPLPPGGWHLPKAIAVILIYLVVLGFLVLAMFLAGRLLVQDILQLLRALPGLIGETVGRVDQARQALGIPPQFLPSGQDLATQVRGLLTRASEAVRLAGVAGEEVAASGFRIIVILTLILFIIVEAEQILAFWLELFPPWHREKVREVTLEIYERVGHWLLGQMSVAAITGTVTAIGLTLLGVPYSFLFGLITGILDLVPFFGATLMIIPAFLVGLSRSPGIAIAAALLVWGAVEFDGHVLSPLITGSVVELPPVVVIIALPLGLALYGPLGALLAIPVAAAFKVVTDEVFLPWLRRQWTAERKE